MFTHRNTPMLILYFSQLHPAEKRMYNSTSKGAYMNKLYEEQTKWQHLILAVLLEFVSYPPRFLMTTE